MPTQIMPITCVHTVGATLSPDNQAELKFLYEADENFSVIPTFGVIPAQVWCEVHTLLNRCFIFSKQ